MAARRAGGRWPPARPFGGPMRPLLLVAALAAALPAAAARAADLPPELPAMEQEGEKWFNTAGDTDLSQNERNEARKKAWTNLYPALEILNRYWDDRPDDQARVEDRIMKVGQMVFWLRKESPLGLLESTGVGPKPSGNVKRNDWGDKPPPEKPGPAGTFAKTPPAPARVRTSPGIRGSAPRGWYPRGARWGSGEGRHCQCAGAGGTRRAR